MTDVLVPSGRAVLAAADGTAVSWLAGCLVGSGVSLDHVPDLPALRAVAVQAVDVLVLEPLLLPADLSDAPLAAFRTAGVPVLALAPAGAWSGACTALAAAGAQPLDLLSPSDPAAVVVARLAAAIRLARAEAAGETPRAERLELERNRVVVQLAGAVAHKLKQPLSVAWGYLELLLEDPESDAELDPLTLHYLREIREAVRTMDDVVNRLQRATVHQTRKYAGALEILNLEGLPELDDEAARQDG